MKKKKSKRTCEPIRNKQAGLGPIPVIRFAIPDPARPRFFFKRIRFGSVPPNLDPTRPVPTSRESFWEGESDGGNGNDDALYGF